MKIALGADSYGFELKEAVKEHLLNKGLEVQDMGINDSAVATPYYETANFVAQKVASKQVDRGILVCGTGMGMAIIANKHPGVYASVCENTNAAEKSRSINNSNILTLGGFITSIDNALAIVNTWLNTEFTQGWEPSIQEWLQNSMQDIAQLENQQFANRDVI